MSLGNRQAANRRVALRNLHADAQAEIVHHLGGERAAGDHLRRLSEQRLIVCSAEVRHRRIALVGRLVDSDRRRRHVLRLNPPYRRYRRSNRKAHTHDNDPCTARDHLPIAPEVDLLVWVGER